MTTLTPATPESAVRKRRVALIAHDHKKDDMVAFAQTYQALLSQCDSLATGITDGRLEEEVGLTMQRMLPGLWGGDLQIGAQSAEGRVDTVIFLRDPMTPQPYEPDIDALVRACDVHSTPCAISLATADLVMSALQRVTPDPKEIHA